MMEVRPGRPRPSDATGTLTELQRARQALRLAEAREFELLAHVADVYAEPETEGAPVVPGTERMVTSADGAPDYAEFAPLEVAVALGEDDVVVGARIAHAVAVRHRLPALWARVMAGQVPVWQAERIATASRELNRDDCRRLDSELAARDGLRCSRVLALVDAFVLRCTAPELVEDRRQVARSRRGVWLAQEDYGLASLTGLLDSADGIFLKAQLDRVADILARGGDQDGADVRRAKALGILASPARALQLIQASLLDQLPEDLDVDCPARGQRGHTCGQITVDPERLLPSARLVVHLSDAGLRDAARGGEALARGEGLQPLLASWLRDLLGHSRVSVRPVLDVEGLVPADSYEVPARMREAVCLRSVTSVFPFSRRRSDGLDLDHTEEFRAGPDGRSLRKGQTRVENLGLLTRRQHRAKTHGGWDCRQIHSGVSVWRSPHGVVAVTTPSGSWLLHTPRSRIATAQAA